MVLDERKADVMEDTDKLEIIIESDGANTPLVEVVKIRLLETG
jgi:hypothetical protein